MRPLRSTPDDFEIRLRASCRSCGKTRELSSGDLYGAASIEAFRQPERRFQCSDCGERSVIVEPIWHKDWAGSREN
jgi:hypothetical protein